MPSYIENLRNLNRKERFYLVGFALDKPSFELGPNFRKVLEDELHITVPADAFVAMDYHISWLYAAAALTKEGTAGPFPGGGGIEKGNQEDVDLVVAFENGGITELLILEAKGVTGWSNKQLRSKVARLRMFFGDAETPPQFDFVRPRFAIVSPLRSAGVDTQGWPDWMLTPDGSINWIEMPTPQTLLKVTRCDERGITSASGGFWKAEPDKVAAQLSRRSTTILTDWTKTP